MKILIVGSSGMLGTDCKEVLSKEHELVMPDKEVMDITSWDGVIENLQKINPDAIINCAAFTDVDACETEDYLCERINVEGPRNLAQCSARFNSRLIHISSDYVFDGKKTVPQPYFEDDSLRPLSAYGVSKMESEKAVRENAPNYIIIRTAWLYGINGPNFVKSIINKALNSSEPIKVVTDQIGSPTWTYRLALQIKALLNSDARGTFHATAEGYCSRFECAEYIIKRLGIDAKLEPATLNDFKSSAVRPANCILENRLLNRQGLNVMHSWQEDLGIFLDKFKNQLLN